MIIVFNKVQIIKKKNVQREILKINNSLAVSMSGIFFIESQMRTKKVSGETRCKNVGLKSAHKDLTKITI